MSRDAKDQLDQIIDKLVRDVEMAVHALYRGDVRQNTVKARTEVHRRTAREAIAPLVGSGSGRAIAAPAAGGAAAVTLSDDDIAALTRCITAWLPMGSPANATAESRCMPGGKEIIPTWGDRERARQAAQRLRQS